MGVKIDRREAFWLKAPKSAESLRTDEVKDFRAIHPSVTPTADIFHYKMVLKISVAKAEWLVKLP